MEKSIKFLGICIAIGLLFLSCAITYNAYSQRYSFRNNEGVPVIAIDRQTGDCILYDLNKHTLSTIENK